MALAKYGYCVIIFIFHRKVYSVYFDCEVLPVQKQEWNSFIEKYYYLGYCIHNALKPVSLKKIFIRSNALLPVFLYIWRVPKRLAEQHTGI